MFGAGSRWASDDKVHMQAPPNSHASNEYRLPTGLLDSNAPHLHCWTLILTSTLDTPPPQSGSVQKCTKAIQVVRIPVCSHKSSLSKQLASRGDDCSRRASKRGGVVVEARARGVSGGRRLGGPHCIYSHRPLPTSGPLPASSSPLPLSA